MKQKTSYIEFRDLPCEILVHLFSELNIKSLIAFSSTSKEMHQTLTRSTILANHIWKKLLALYFPALYRTHKKELQLIERKRTIKNDNNERTDLNYFKDNGLLKKTPDSGSLPIASSLNTGLSSVYYSIFIGCCKHFISTLNKQNKTRESFRQLFFHLKDHNFLSSLIKEPTHKIINILQSNTILENNFGQAIVENKSHNDLNTIFCKIERSTKRNWLANLYVKLKKNLGLKDKTISKTDLPYWAATLREEHYFETAFTQWMTNLSILPKRKDYTEDDANTPQFQTAYHYLNLKFISPTIQYGNIEFIKKALSKLEPYFYCSLIKYLAIEMLNALIKNHHTKLAEHFISKWTKNQDIATDNSFFKSLLLTAAETGNITIVKLLVDFHKTDINSESSDPLGKENPLLLAAENGKKMVVDFLIMASDSLVLKARKKNERTAIFYIAKEWGIECLTPLLKKIDKNSAALTNDLIFLIEAYHELKITTKFNTTAVNGPHKNKINILLFDANFNFKDIKEEKIANITHSIDLLIKQGRIDLMHKPKNKTIAQSLKLNYKTLYDSFSKLSRAIIDFYCHLSKAIKKLSSEQQLNPSERGGIKKAIHQIALLSTLKDKIQADLIQAGNKLRSKTKLESEKEIKHVLNHYPTLKKSYETLKQNINLTNNKKSNSANLNNKTDSPTISLNDGPKQ